MYGIPLYYLCIVRDPGFLCVGAALRCVVLSSIPVLVGCLGGGSFKKQDDGTYVLGVHIADVCAVFHLSLIHI